MPFLDVLRRAELVESKEDEEQRKTIVSRISNYISNWATSVAFEKVCLFFLSCFFFIFKWIIFLSFSLPTMCAVQYIIYGSTLSHNHFNYYISVFLCSPTSARILLVYLTVDLFKHFIIPFSSSVVLTCYTNEI